MLVHCKISLLFLKLYVVAAELVSHRDRISRHSQGVIAAVNEQKATIQNLVTQHELQVPTFMFTQNV